jgi:tetratricopeptide (TPR) repeat protein
VLAGSELASAYADLGDFDQAGQLATVAAERALELEQTYMIATAQDALAYLHELNGEWQQALAVRGVAVEAARGSDNRLIPMITGPGLAEALLEAEQDAKKAEELVQEALQITERAKYPIPAARALRVLGRIYAFREELESASEAFAEALKLCEEWNTHLIAGRILLDWASLENSQGAQDAAASKLERAMNIFETAQAEYWVKRTREALSELTTESAS